MSEPNEKLADSLDVLKNLHADLLVVVRDQFLEDAGERQVAFSDRQSITFDLGRLIATAASGEAGRGDEEGESP